VVFGPGDGGTAHQPDEHIAVADLSFATSVLALAAGRLLNEQEREST
jgi:acetylornithine deacetylase/succinyl-diaminopimelate desuccinylase-like protein